MKLETLQSALKAYGTYPYRDESSYALPRAQRALSGRTHYVDDDTLRYFKARINSSWVTDDGLYFVLLESVAHPAMGRVHRAVVFDVFGDVLTERDAFRKTKNAAHKDLDTFFAGKDAILHTETKLREYIARDERRLNETRSILES